jgi:hypothetical protein
MAMPSPFVHNSFAFIVKAYTAAAQSLSRVDLDLPDGERLFCQKGP